jgi:hypothetical protein
VTRTADAAVLPVPEHGDAGIAAIAFDQVPRQLRARIVDDEDARHFRTHARQHVEDLPADTKTGDNDRDSRRRHGGHLSARR